MDTVGWFIAMLHQYLGHDKAAAFIDEEPLNRNCCILCLYEKGQATKAQVIERIGRGASNG